MSGLAGSWLDDLHAAIGDGAADDFAEIDVDGLGLVPSLSPPDADAFGRVLESLSASGRSAWIHGGGTQMGLGNLVRHADVALSTRRLTGIDIFDAQDGVLHAGAGTKLSELRERANAEGWEVPLDPPGEARGATLGGVLSTSAIGPRRLGFGPPRDCVLGLGVVLASGERTRCGGRVVKNVTGYDLAKLYTGAFGTLGVIESAWLRLRPLPEQTVQRRVDVANREKGILAGVAAAQRYTARAVALLSPGLVRKLEGLAESEVSSWQLFAEFAGDAAAVEHDAAGFDKATRGAGSAPAGSFEWTLRVAQLQGEAVAARAMRARVAVLPSRLSRLCSSLRRSGAELIVYPGLGLVYALFEDCEVEATAESVARAASEAGGSLLFEAMSDYVKARLDVFAVPESPLSLMRLLKQRFDAAGVLNPGRFAGGI